MKKLKLAPEIIKYIADAACLVLVLIMFLAFDSLVITPTPGTELWFPFIFFFMLAPLSFFSYTTNSKCTTINSEVIRGYFKDLGKPSAVTFFIIVPTFFSILFITLHIHHLKFDEYDKDIEQIKLTANAESSLIQKYKETDYFGYAVGYIELQTADEPNLRRFILEDLHEKDQATLRHIKKCAIVLNESNKSIHPYKNNLLTLDQYTMDYVKNLHSKNSIFDNFRSFKWQHITEYYKNGRVFEEYNL